MKCPKCGEESVEEHRKGMFTIALVPQLIEVWRCSNGHTYGRRTSMCYNYITNRLDAIRTRKEE